MSNSTMTPSVNKDEWTQVAGKAKDVVTSAGEMANHAGSAIGAMASQAASDVGNKADELTASAGHSLQGLGAQISKNTPHTGMLGTASQAFARTVRDGGEYIEEAKLSGITEDVTQLVRRNPITAILIAIGLGWYVGRKLGS